MTSTLTARTSPAGTIGTEDSMRSYAQLAQVHANNMQSVANAFQLLCTSLAAQREQRVDDVFRTGAETVASHKG